MKHGLPFTHTAPELIPTLQELVSMEPIFHTSEFGKSVDEFDSMMAADYWEVGASGRRYSRDFILRNFGTKLPELASDLGWQSSQHALRELGANTYLLTYVLLQGDRSTRRATIWQRTGKGWKILYHQGTTVAFDEDDVFPS